MKKLIIGFLFLICALVVGAGKAQALETPYLNAKYVGGDQVMLWWTNVGSADSYQILYGPKGDEWAHGAALPATTSYTVSGLFRNTSYVFRVKAVQGGEVSGYSNTVWVTTSGAGRTTVAMTPSSTTTAQVGQVVDGRVVTPAVHYNNAADTMRSDATPNSPYISSGKWGYGEHNLRTSRGWESGSITLHWNEPMKSNVGNYNLVYTDDPKVEKWGVLGIPVEARNYTVRGLTSGKRYWFWMSSEQMGQTPWVSDLAR